MKRVVGLLVLMTCAGSAWAVTLWTQTYSVGESVTVSVGTTNSPVFARPVSATLMQVYATSASTIVISKTEQLGGYAHGVSYWINHGARNDVLYSYFGNGSISLSLSAGSLLEIQLYRVVVIFYNALGSVYQFQTNTDVTGPSFAPSPGPGTSRSTTVSPNASDGGSGLDTAYGVQWTLAKSGGPTTSGPGSVSLTAEGSYSVTFSARDNLGNTASWQGTYVIDTTPPALSNVISSASRRADGALDYRVQFNLSDPAGVNLSSLQVQLIPQTGQPWSFATGSLTVTGGTGGTITVAIPVTAVPPDAHLGLRVVASDAVGNTLDSSDAAYSVVLPPAKVQGAVTAGSVTGSLDPPNGVTRTPQYSIPIAFDRPRDSFVSSGVSSYRLTRTVGGSGTTEVVRDVAPAAFRDALTDVGGLAVFTDSVTGSAYSHQQITYSLQTVFAVPGSETSSLGAATMPNIAAWAVRLLAQSGALLASYYSGTASFGNLAVESYQNIAAVIGPDPEGDPLSMSVEYTGPDGMSGVYPASGTVTQALLSDLFGTAPDGIYQLRFLIQENGSSTIQTSPLVTLTVDAGAGQIIRDVTWSTDQILSGSLVIRAGASLHITGGATVTVANVVEMVDGQPRPDGSPTITVENGASLVLDGGTTIQPAGWGTADGWKYWGGIYVSGALDGGAATIRGAIRGLIALPGSLVTLHGTSFDECRTGIHALGSTPTIDGASFVDSARYGIKEDAGASPLVTNSLFQGNTYDYYDEQLTVVDANGINTLPPVPGGQNSGNRKVP